LELDGSFPVNGRFTTLVSFVADDSSTFSGTNFAPLKLPRLR
jgi:hypothetical protein